jgi:hypothetical protein
LLTYRISENKLSPFPELSHNIVSHDAESSRALFAPGDKLARRWLHVTVCDLMFIEKFVKQHKKCRYGFLWLWISR